MKEWVLNEATIATHVFVLDFSLTYIAFVLYFYKLGVDNKAKNFDYIPDYLVCRDRFY